MEIRFIFKFFFVSLFVVFTNLSFWDRLNDIGLQLGLAVYLFIWCVSLAFIFLLAFQKFSVVKLIISLLLVLSAAMSSGYYFVTKQYMEFYEFENMVNAANNAGDAFVAFDGLVWVIIIGVVGLLAMNVSSSIELKRKKLTIIASFLFVCGLIITVLFARDGEGSKGLPTQFSTASYSIILLSGKIISNTPSKPPVVEIVADESVVDGDIVFIMDESIRGDYLDINSPDTIKSGLLKFKDKFINFGLMSSMSNCSDSNNLSMRFGVSRDSYLHDIKNNPSIWQYAKAAGYKVNYIDAQLTDGVLGNHMTDNEINSIDFFQQIIDGEDFLYNKDIVVANILTKKLNDNVKDFIFINKMGVHFPYEGKYPESEAHHQPAMVSSNFYKSYPEIGEIEWPSNNDALTRLKFLNSYKNALRWNLSSFFTALFKDKLNKPYFMIYTSDHGQTFHDDGREGYGTHCSITVTDPEEGRVPFLVFTNIVELKNKMLAAAKLNFNKASQFNLPATLYNLMGYSLTDLSQYEKSLYEPLDKKDQQFLSKYFVRFGASPVWNSINKDSDNDL